MSAANNGILMGISLSVWSGRKLDKAVSAEVDVAKSTKARAGNYNKNLFAGVTELEDVRCVGGKIRNWHHDITSPWADNGDRLLPMSSFTDVKQRIKLFEQEFTTAKDTFCDKYAQIISQQAFTMGALFNRNDYPDIKDIAQKFSLSYTFCPVPLDWRVDADEDTKREVQEHYQKVYNDRLAGVTKDLWDRLHTCLTHMNERLTDVAGEKKIFRDSLMNNAVDLCGLLTKLNIANDPKLEAARKQLESAICNMDVKDLRADAGARKEVQVQVDDILKKFSW